MAENTQLVLIASGPFSATYDGNDVGVVEGLYRVQMQQSAQEVRDSKHGDTVVDGIYVGGNMFMVAQFKEWTPATKAIMWPWAATMGESGSHGRLLSDLASPFVLTAAPGSPAASVGPLTVTMPRAIYAPRHNQEWTFGLAERIVPIVLQLLPCATGPSSISEVTWFETTEPA